MNQCCSAYLSIVCTTAKWPNGSVTQLPGNSHLKVGHGSFPKEAFGHEVIRCAELYSPNHGVSGTGRIPVPGESAHVSICSTPVEEAHTKWGSSFEGHKRLCLCTSYDLCKVVFAIFFSLQCLSALLAYPCRSAVLSSILCHPPVQGVQGTVCCSFGSCCFMLSQEGREAGEGFRSSESRSKAVSGTKFTVSLLAWCFCSFLVSFCVSWLIAARALSTSACFLPSHMPAPAASHGPGRDVTKIKAGKRHSGSSVLLTQ